MSTAPWPSHDANGQRLVACARGRDTRCRTHICSLAKCATAAGSRVTACARHRHARAFAKHSLPLGRAHECVRLSFVANLWMHGSLRLRKVFLAQDDATSKVVGSRASVCASGDGRLTRRRRSIPRNPWAWSMLSPRDLGRRRRPARTVAVSTASLRGRPSGWRRASPRGIPAQGACERRLSRRTQLILAMVSEPLRNHLGQASPSSSLLHFDRSVLHSTLHCIDVPMEGDHRPGRRIRSCGQRRRCGPRSSRVVLRSGPLETRPGSSVTLEKFRLGACDWRRFRPRRKWWPLETFAVHRRMVR